MQEGLLNYLGSRTEKRADGSKNITHLFECGDNPSLEQIIMYCRDYPKDLPEFFFNHIIFFDKEEHAVFSKYPSTACYGDEFEVLEHIKAIYAYSPVNKFSRLSYYPNITWDAKPNRVEIKI